MSIPAAKEQSEKNGEREGEQQLTPFSPSSSSSSQGWKPVWSQNDKFQLFTELVIVHILHLCLFLVSYPVHT